jgi:thioester reductase-like protein
LLAVSFVVHNGAYVNHVMEYREMRAVNVLGLLEVLKLCAAATKKKRLVMVSTTGVVPVLPGNRDDDVIVVILFSNLI